MDWSHDVTVEASEFRGFYKALSVRGGSDITVQDNNVHTIRSDGFNFNAVEGVRVEGNYLHDFVGAASSGDHRDMIQFWTIGDTRPSSDV